MKEKRSLLKTFEICLIIGSIVLGVSNTIVTFCDIGRNNVEIQNDYKTKKEKCELLRTIPSVCIEEGKGINTQEISNKDIKYEIYNDNENVIFYYYIEGENPRKNPYKAKITLSNDYKIIDEKYDVELEDFETFKKWCQVYDITGSVGIGMLTGFCLYLFGSFFMHKQIKSKKL